jgi:nicotinic acid phosphoribosyltransferase
MTTASVDIALLTDLYQLTMACGYWKAGTVDREAVFRGGRDHGDGDRRRARGQPSRRAGHGARPDRA